MTFQLSVSKVLKFKAAQSLFIWIIFPFCVFPQVQICALESDLIQFMENVGKRRQDLSFLPDSSWQGGVEGEEGPSAEFILGLLPFHSTPSVLIILCGWHLSPLSCSSFFLLVLKSKQEILFSSESLSIEEKRRWTLFSANQVCPNL